MSAYDKDYNEWAVPAEEVVRPEGVVQALEGETEAFEECVKWLEDRLAAILRPEDSTTAAMKVIDVPVSPVLNTIFRLSRVRHRLNEIGNRIDL